MSPLSWRVLHHRSGALDMEMRWVNTTNGQDEQYISENLVEIKISCAVCVLIRGIFFAAWQVAAGNTAIGGVGALRFGKLFGNIWEHTQNPLENQGRTQRI